MSKRRLLARGIIFGYGATGAQMLYSFASIPLALTHLSKAEFGMWSLITTVVGYLMLAEMGITNSVTRHLLECKEGVDPEKYGRLFFGSAIAMSLIAVVIGGAGFVISHFAFRLFPVPQELTGTFINVMMGQSLLMSVNMATQMVGVPLYVHHRQDIGQINQIGLFLIYFVVLHLAFKAGWGIYAMLANQAAGIIWSLVFTFFACHKLGFYPKRLTWAFPTRNEWNSVLRYSRDVFAVQIGGMVLSSLPQLLIARLLGLETSAAWAVATRVFAILGQIVARPFSVALPMIYDAYIRREMRTVATRWEEVTQVVLAAAGAVFAVAAANNALFIHLWTGGKIHWDERDQWLLALYFYISTAAGLAYGTIGIDKSIGRSKFIGFAQSVMTVALAFPATKYFGLSGLLLAITFPFFPGMISFGVRYLGRITNISIRSLAWKAIVRPSLAVPVAALLAWACSLLADLLPGYFGLLLSSATGTLLAIAAMSYIGVSPGVRRQIFAMAGRLFNRIIPACRAEA